MRLDELSSVKVRDLKKACTTDAKEEQLIVTLKAALRDAYDNDCEEDFIHYKYYTRAKDLMTWLKRDRIYRAIRKHEGLI